MTSTAAAFENGVAAFTFAQYGATLQATFANGQLAGEYKRARGGPYPFRATKAAAAAPRASGNAPSIASTWIVSAKSTKGEIAWRFIAKQTGADVAATILRVDGDTGTLTGGYRDGKFVLSHFSGARPLLLEVTPAADGTLRLTQNGQTELIAAKEGASRAAAIGTPTDPAEHTRMKNPGERLQFSFRDLEGRTVSHTDPKFAGKVLLVNISGSWCPIATTRRRSWRISIASIVREGSRSSRSRSRKKTSSPTRRGFAHSSRTTGWTTRCSSPAFLTISKPRSRRPKTSTRFRRRSCLGVSGRVRAIHAGFPSAGGGEFYSKAQRDIIGHVERLLAGTRGNALENAGAAGAIGAVRFTRCEVRRVRPVRQVREVRLPLEQRDGRGHREASRGDALSEHQPALGLDVEGEPPPVEHRFEDGLEDLADEQRNRAV